MSEHGGCPNSAEAEPRGRPRFGLLALLLDWRKSALFLVALISVSLGSSALALRVDPGVESMIPHGPGDLEQLQTFHALFGADEVIVLALHSDQLFSRDSLARLHQLTERVASLPQVARVLSPTNLRDIDGDALGPAPVVPYARVVSGKMTPEALGTWLGSHPLFGGLLVAKDARTAALLVEPEPATGSVDGRGGLVADLRRLAGEAGPGVTAFVAGIPVEKHDVARYIARDQKIFVPLVFLILVAMTAVLYRHPVGVMVPLTVVTLALVWTLGIFGVAGKSLNPVTSLMTPVILVMSLEGAIQLINQYLAARAEGLPLRPALERAHRFMRIPCFNAALTAAIGFVSLLTLPIPAIRDFGAFTAIGIMIGYGLTIGLTPLLLASLPDFPPGIIRTFEPGPVERGLSRIVRWVCEHRWTTAIFVGVILLVSVAGVTQIRVETDLIRSLRHASPLAAATRFIDARLTGVNSIEIVIPEVSARDPVALGQVARFEEAVRNLPDVRKVTGLTDLLARINRAMPRGDDQYARLPEGPEASADLADFITGLRKEAPADVRRFLADGASDRATLRVNARVPALDTGRSQALFARIREAAGHAGLPGVSLTGNFVVFSNMSTTLVQHQARGLGLALVLIVVVMAIQFRSMRLGLLCTIPNGAPILVVYGLMGWSGVALSVPTAMIASVAIGTIVDNSIYLLARFREAFTAQADYVSALTSMVRSSGRAVVYSTVTLAVGFWVGVFSSFVPTVHFGILTGSAFLLGLIGPFVVLPLCLILFQPLGRPARRAVAVTMLLAVMSVAAALFAATPALAQDGQRDVLLKEQFGKTDGPGRHRGQPFLVIFGTVDGMRRMKAWEDQIRDKVPGAKTLIILRGLDARRAIGQMTEAEVNERLQQNVPADIAILVDWKGQFIRAYALPDVDVSTTVVDTGGKTCRTVAGPVTPEGLDLVRQLLLHVRQTGSCP